MPEYPRVGKMPTTSTINWSNGVPFNGYMWFGLIPPIYGSTDATSVDWGGFVPESKIPQVFPIPIVSGKFNTQLGLYYNADLMPPNSQYNAFLVDTTFRVLGSAAPFTVSDNPVSNVPSITATVPSTGGTAPVPD